MLTGQGRCQALPDWVRRRAAALIAEQEIGSSARRKWRIRVVIVVFALTSGMWFIRRELPSLPLLEMIFGHVNVPLLGVAGGLEAVSLWCFARQQQSLLAAFGVRVAPKRALAIVCTGTALAMTVPAGPVVSAGFVIRQYRRVGVDRRTSTVAIVLSGLVSVAGLCLLYLLCALTVVVLPRPADTVAGVVASLGLFHLGIRLANRHADNHPPQVTRSGALSFALPSGIHWLAATNFAAVNWAADLACLAAVGAALGLHVSIVQIGMIYLGIQIVRQLPLGLGGAGVVETALAVALTTADGDNAVALATALAYRMLSCWLVVLAGLITWLLLHRSHQHRSEADETS